MKLFLFSDLHCNHKQLSNLSDFLVGNKKIAALIFAGDAVNMGEPVSFMEQFIKAIDNIGKPLLWVPGNNDFGRAYHKLNAKYKSLEGRVAKLPSTCHPEHIRQSQCKLREGSPGFTGVGGSPASWAGQYQGESMINQKEIADSIFVSHYPPPANIKLEKFDVENSKLETRISETNSNDQNSNKQNCHSERSEESLDKLETSSQRSFVSVSTKPSLNGNNQDDNKKAEKQYNNLATKQFANAPKVHICGHLHYRWGTAFVGSTKIIQLASLETGHYAILDLETLSVNFERF